MSAVPPISHRRPVITGIGVVAPNGIGTETWWEATKKGTTGIRRISRFDPSKYGTRLAGEVEGFEVENYVDPRLVMQSDRGTWMALAAADMALRDAGFDPAGHNPHRIGVSIASSSPGNEFGQREMQNLWRKGPIFVGAYQSVAWFQAAAASQISIKHGVKGPLKVVAAEAAGGLEAVQEAGRMIRRGADVVVTGGAEAPLTPFALAAQTRTGFLSVEQDPKAAYRPFDARANGYVPGEGGAILLVEDLEFAQRRGASHIYGEIAGYGATSDAYHYAKPDPQGRELARAMRLAVEQAGVGPQDLDVIFADGVGTPEGDDAEAGAINHLFSGEAVQVPVTVPKAMTGRIYAAGAAFDLAAALLAMRDKCIPPTINLDLPAKSWKLDFVTEEARSSELRQSLITARGFGGLNGALVLRTV